MTQINPIARNTTQPTRGCERSCRMFPNRSPFGRAAQRFPGSDSDFDGASRQRTQPAKSRGVATRCWPRLFVG